MLQSIRDLGLQEIQNSKDSDNSDVRNFIELSKLKNTKKVLCIVLEKSKNGFEYKRVTIEDYKEPEKYLYRSHQSRQFDITPTTKISFDIKNKKLKIDEALGRILYWFDKFIPNFQDDGQKSDKEFLEAIKNGISENKQILNGIINASKELKQDKNPRNNEKLNTILTVKMIENGKERYIGDFSVFRNALRNEGSRFLYFRHGVEIRGKGICNLCQEKKEVYDYFPMNVYSTDKRGFSPYFIREDSWKRLPVCSDCTPSLMRGWDFIGMHLKKDFYGYKFYVIPKFFVGKLDYKFVEEIKRARDKNEYTGLLSIEDKDILDIIFRDEEYRFNLIFVFCKIGQSTQIIRFVENVSPSWIKRIYNTFMETSNLSITQEEILKQIGLISKKKNGNLKYIDKDSLTFAGFIKSFFPSSKETGIYEKYFLDIVSDILSERRINQDFLINSFVREIRNRHINDKNWEEKLLSVKSLLLLMFLDRLILLKSDDKQLSYGSLLLDDFMKEEKIQRIKKFFDEYDNAFNTPSKRGVFLEGVLCNFLLAIQYTKRGSDPFKSKLYGLELDENKIKKLLPMIKEKLWEYDANYYNWLEELISRYFIEAEKTGFDMSKDEISYYFALGLNVGRIFKDERDSNDGGEEAWQK